VNINNKSNGNNKNDNTIENVRKYNIIIGIQMTTTTLSKTQVKATATNITNNTTNIDHVIYIRIHNEVETTTTSTLLPTATTIEITTTQ